MSDDDRQEISEDAPETIRAVLADLGEILVRGGNFATGVILCSLMLIVLRRRYGIHAGEAMPLISHAALDVLRPHQYVGAIYLGFSDFAEMKIDEALESGGEMYSELEEAVGQITHPGSLMYCTGHMAAIVAMAHDVKVESLMAVIGESAERLEHIAKERGVFEST